MIAEAVLGRTEAGNNLVAILVELRGDDDPIGRGGRFLRADARDEDVGGKQGDDENVGKVEWNEFHERKNVWR